MQFFLGEKSMTTYFFGTLLPKLEKTGIEKKFLAYQNTAVAFATELQRIQNH